MIPLPTNSYYKAAEAIQKVTINNLFARTVIEQNMDGWIFVDQIEKPTTFYVKHAYGMSLLFGDCQNEKFNNELTSFLQNKDKKREIPEWLQVFPTKWDQVLSDLLKEQIIDLKDKTATNESQVIRNTRVNFRFNRDKFQPIKTNGHETLKLVKLDKNLFDQIHGTVVPKYFWRNKAEFEKMGSGLCLLLENKPISTVFSAFVHHPKIELGIETLSEYQGNGFAQITSSAMIEDCIKNGLEPIWACRFDNVGSFKLAEKLGFEVEKMIPYYELPIN
ncbi:GNAT family N-acetyltransferase [Sunxiuqinia sp. A32]|uniref:GNAT family N-acetyltransferase n=1 Tax=Sunxiuqinia sp. A32 TaxID=3461496 RepID=UPI0040461EDE